MKVQLFALMLLTTLLIPVASLYSQDQILPGSLTGFVTDLVTNAPIKDAKVVIIVRTKPEAGILLPSSGIGSYVGKTDENGSYLIENIPPSTYKVAAEVRDYIAERKDVEILSNQASQLDFELNPCINGATGNMKGMITDSITSQPIGGAYVSIKIPFMNFCKSNTPDNQLRFFAITDETGFYEIKDIPVGKYEVDSHAKGYKLADKICTIDFGNDTQMDFMLTPCDSPETGSVEGIITDLNTGLPIKYATIFINDRKYEIGCGNIMNRQKSGDNGDFLFEKIPSGTHIIAAQTKGYKKFSGEVTVVTGQTTQYDIAMTSLKSLSVSSIKGIVVDSSDNPVENAKVMVASKNIWHSMDVKGLTTTTDSKGNFSFDKIPVGDCIITANKPKIGKGSVSVTVEENIPIDVTIKLDKTKLKH
jgi:large repetitive protein